jgi:lysophospholipase L1-like esterase
VTTCGRLPVRTMKTILCYGDSNTWGFMPETGSRYPPDVRWTGVLGRLLSPEFRVIEEGLNGRTTVWDDPLLPGRNGKVYLGPCLESPRPLDVVVLFLGLNDLKKRYSASAEDIARGAGVLLDVVLRSGAGANGRAPATLVLAPPPLGRLSGFAEAFEGAQERSFRVAPFLRQIALSAGSEFVDTAGHVAFSETDGLHFDSKAHATVGELVARTIRAMAI